MSKPFQCKYEYDNKKIKRSYKAIAKINGTVYGNAQKVDMYVIWFICPIPDELINYGKTLSRGQSWGKVNLLQPKNDFICKSIDIKWYLQAPIKQYDITLCTSCVYGLKSNQWLIEYLEYYRQLGVNHVEMYTFRLGKIVEETLDIYRQLLKFVSVHDWDNPIGHRGIGYGVRLRNWEHGQILTRNDCYLRHYGVSDYIILADIDELWYLENKKLNLYDTIKSLDTNEHHIAFNGASATIAPYVYKESLKRSQNSAKKYIVPFWISQLITEEKSCTRPFNCGKYHYGRQKYILKTAPNTLSTLSSIWYHAVSIEYSIADKWTTQIPSNLLYIRHYNKQFTHVRNGLAKNNRKIKYINATILSNMSKFLLKHPTLLQLYKNSPTETFHDLHKLYDKKRIVN